MFNDPVYDCWWCGAKDGESHDRDCIGWEGNADLLREAAKECDALAAEAARQPPGYNWMVTHYRATAALLRAIADAFDLADKKWDGLDEYYMHGNLNLMKGITRGRKEIKHKVGPLALALANVVLGEPNE